MNDSVKKESESTDFAVKGMRYLKKVVLFCFAYIVIFTVTMIVIYCVKGDYPETLCTLTFAFFSIEAVVSALIKIFESVKAKFKKPKETYDVYDGMPSSQTEERETEYNGDS